MCLSLRAKNELQRRIDLLPREVNTWYEGASANVNNLGIHRSQFLALKTMMDELLQRQYALLNQLTPGLTNQQCAENYLALTDELVGVHDLWRIFRIILTQHQDDNFKRCLNAADLVAADCYLTCMNKARGWGLVEEQQFREPPLTYLEADAAPSTASRGYTAQSLGFPLRQYRNMRLPIPIVLLPFDHATSLWMFSTLHHEVGHNIDQDLKLQQEMLDKLLTSMNQGNIPQERQRMWWQWGGEILADVFGVLLAGVGFAHALCWWLLAMAPAERFQELNAKDAHPPFYVRVHLIATMLQKLNIAALTQAADEILKAWDEHQKPAWVAPYTADANLIADVFIDQKLKALGGQRSLRDFNPNLADDVALAQQVAECLPSNFNCPNPTIISFPPRLVPVAAQLAAMQLQNPTVQNLDAIQTNALGYLERIPRPEFLAGIARQDFLRGLARELDFRRGN